MELPIYWTDKVRPPGFSRALLGLLVGLVTLAGLAASAPAGQPAQGKNGEEILQRAEADFGKGQLEEAFRECQKAIEQNPGSARAYYLLGVIQDRRGAADEARQALQRSVALDPNRVDSRIYLGELYLHLKEFDRAAAEFQSAVKFGDDDSSEGRFGFGLALLSQSKYEEALPHLTAAVQASPCNLQRLASLIEAEVELKRLDEARTHLNQLDALPPEGAQMPYKLGELFLKHGMPGDAERELERAARLLEGQAGSPPSEMSPAALYVELAEARFKRRDYWEALRDLAKVPLAALAPKHQAEVLRFKAGVLLGAGNPTEALREIQEAAQLHPANDADLMQQAWAQLLVGNPQAATEAMKPVATRFPYSSEVRQTAALIERERLPPRPEVPANRDWHLKGEGFVCCPCEVPCPCRSNGSASHGHCETAGAFRIDQGHYGKVRLDGVVYVTVIDAMETVEAPLTLFVDRDASDEQVIALERIYQAFSPLEPFMFPNVERVRISFIQTPRNSTYEVEIPGRVQLKIHRQLDARGRPLMQTAAVDYLSNTVEYAQNLIDKVWDAGGGLQWDYGHRQANLRFIDLDARDYQEGRMLVQFHDYSGFFTPKQLELIKGLNLPMLPSYPRAD
jgi:tetratricopeptide (TPR) repeat protein